MKNLKKVEILWRDTSEKPGWRDDVDVQEKEDEPDYVMTVGYLLKKTRDKVLITSGHSCWHTYMNIYSIPKKSIVAMSYLTIKDG